MTTTTFDTLGYAKKLEAAGFTRPQAEAQAEIIRDQTEAQNAALQKALENRNRELATRDDMQGVRLEIERVKAEIRATELRLLKWQFGIALALAAIMSKGFGWLGF